MLTVRLLSNVFIGWICICFECIVTCCVLLWLRFILPEVKKKNWSLDIHLKRTGSPVLLKCEVLPCLPIMAFSFLRIQFFSKSFPCLCHVYLLIKSQAFNLKRLQMCNWSKFIVLTRRRRPRCWRRVIIQRVWNVSEIHKLRKKGDIIPPFVSI